MPPQTPAVYAAMLVLSGGVLLVLTLGPLIGFLVLRQLWLGRPVLEYEPRRQACWGLIDLGLAVGLFIVFSILGGLLLTLLPGISPFDPQSKSDVEAKLMLMLVAAVAQILAAATTAVIILLRTGCSWSDLGFSAKHLARDLYLGGAAFCALAIPTYGLQFILVQFWKSEHPLIESLKLESNPQALAIALFAAVIAAPLAEEFAFRVLLQGWLEKMFSLFGKPEQDQTMTLLLGESVRSKELDSSVLESSPDNSLAQEIVIAELAVPTEAEERSTPAKQRLWAIPNIIASAIFALLHFSHGPDWIPLFVLSLGLGYLYHCTHRITPSLVVHFLLNLMSMLALCLEIYQVKGP